MDTPRHTNRLIHETSPYLLQHAHNPVDWHAWGAEALERARREDKPILLSIGYSACHWCHVMEHESFEDEAVARVMNDLFVCIKVDREERPDLDRIYQTAHQILAQRPGGWPLNMFLTPHDHMPFFGGTYFPREPRYGMPSFVDVLTRVAGFYHEKREEVLGQNEQLRSIFERLQPAAPAPGQHLNGATIERAVQDLARQYDRRYGGFGGAPKFPHPTSLELLLRQHARSHEREALEMARHTLRAMALGGICDQVGGGFCRYSVDEQWMIPHFEKMLYDNAALLALYADAHAACGDGLFARTAMAIGEWTLREMQSPEGGYYSALDADSEGHEGKFYVWDAEEIRRLLAPGEWELIEARYGLAGTPNFEGRWHLHARLDDAALADRFQVTESEVITRLAAAHRKLFATRERRVRPGRDDKVLTSWNALMIKGMARAAWRLDRADFLASAERAFDFVRATLWKDGRLLATCKDGKAHLNAYLDDYAFLMDAGLELLQARWRTGDLEFVRTLADVVLDHFEDEAHGGFFFTADDHERLVHRPKPVSDDATPSGNGVAAFALARLGHLLGDLHCLNAASRALEALYRAVADYPSAHGALLAALDEHLHPPQVIVLRGEPEAMRPWLESARRGYVPWRLTFAIPADVALAGPLAERKPLAPVTAYVCEGHACQAPATTRAAFEAALATTAVK
jgi:uncharacterized protein YyaL (SSP411 family)